MADYEKRGTSGSEAQDVARGQKLQSDVSQPVSAAEAAKSLAGIDFPASRDDLVHHASQKHARQTVIEVLHNMANKEYHSMADVEHEFSQEKKHEK